MIYMDNAATTRLHPKAWEKMQPYLREQFANPAGGYEFAKRCNRAVEEARKEIADTLGCQPAEILFTSGGTEGDNWILRSSIRKKAHAHIITTKIEHHAILHTCRMLEEEGVTVTYLPVDELGMVRPKDVERAITRDTCLISVMTANNEIGTIQPMQEIGQIARKYQIPFHTDAVQAYGHIPISIRNWGLSYLTASAHKFKGPKGCGFVYRNAQAPLIPMIAGGGQENGLRSGTTNVAGTVGMATAARIANEEMESRRRAEMALRGELWKAVSDIPYMRLNGHPVKRLTNNLNLSFQFIEGQSLLILLDMHGICASSASACSKAEPSHVLQALGYPEELIRGTLRLTLSEENTSEEVQEVAAVLRASVQQLRDLSPEYAKICEKKRRMVLTEREVRY